ncbi:MAG: DUF5916 domain-containing protein [Bacteroidales bacterium]|jgi:hypothetical protein|nr:DUF5916 domain-containing protein [Bacteroidales bacterium]
MNYLKTLLVFLVLFQSSSVLLCQSRAINRDKYVIRIAETSEKITLDGILDEETWKTAERTGMFQRVTPTDTGFAKAQTTVMVAHDGSDIYLAAVCYDPTPGKRPVQSLRRDFSFMGNDNFAVFFDTFNDQTNGFGFYVSAAGVQYDHLGYDGSRVNISWDAKWRSSVKSYDDKWIAEMSIPLRNLRYNDSDTIWGINFGRLDLKTNEKSAWAPMPRQFNHCDLAYTGTLVWDKPLSKSGLRFSLIPYLTGKVTRDFQTDDPAKWSKGAGFDAKVMLSNSLNLDVTVNPDYSQVEEDRQVTNLDRFEQFFPERRQFFLENSDLFANLGNAAARPFFSRRIGLNVPVTAGMRLSGKLNDKLRIGLMDMQTGGKDNTPAGNYFVTVLQQQVFSRSSISAFMINKQITSSYSDTVYHGLDYNRVAGLEYNLASPDNRWTGKAFYHQSFYSGAKASSAAASGNINFSTRFFRASMTGSWIGADYISEMGYIRRNGYYEMAPTLRYTMYPEKGIVLSHGPSLNYDMLWDTGFNITDRNTSLGYSIGFRDRSQINVNASENFVLLSRSFSPTNTGGVPLPAGSSYSWQDVEAGFDSDSRKLFTYSFDAGYGSYYNGTRWNVGVSAAYRFQPYGSIELRASFNDILLPEPYNSAKLILISPKLDITITDKIFLTTFVQYNDQVDNLNTNIRFQWRFAPVSDLFIVYSENSYTGDFTSKNRGLVVKVSYWFN